MPSAVPHSRRRRRADESDSDNEGPTKRSRSGTPFSQTSNGSKRVRLASQHNLNDSSEDEDRKVPIAETEDESDLGSDNSGTGNTGDGSIPPTVVPNTTSPRVGRNSTGRLNNDSQRSSASSAKHRAGAIVRVKLTNFVTYTSAECFPGPRLNMVIGPNGTGKSTFVCAICLGLGWGPQYLGRAKDAAEFVKDGSNEAVVEIELERDARFRQNPVICRTIKREGNKSTFTIDGKQATKARVLELARSFSIQIDNLCQFLPQDKVSEFAALSAIDLLQSTQRAAAGPEMLEWHENLKRLRAEQKRYLANSSGDREVLKNLENRQQMQRDDVDRMRQREHIKNRIEYLELARPVPRYKELREQYTTQTEQMRELVNERRELKNQLEPAMRAVNAKKDYYSKIEAVLKQKRIYASRGDEAAKNIAKKMVEGEDKMKDLSRQVEAERNSGRSQVDEFRKLQQAMNRIQRQMEEEPVEFDAAAYTEKIRDRLRRSREIEEKARDLKERRRTTVQSFETKKADISRSEGRLQSLASQSGQQEEKLRNMSFDSYKAWDWIKKNQDKFEKHVFGPPAVECSVKDPKYANAVESLMQRNDFTAFTTQTRADFRTLQRVLNSEMKLHDITIKTCTLSLSSLNPPVPDNQLRELGFDGWAKDFITGPEPVLAMLCSENRFHQTPVVLRDFSDEEYRMMENSPISTWVTGKQSYQVIRRREYGPSATSTRVRQLRPARVWTDQPVDSSAQRELERQINEYKHDLETVQATIDEEKATLNRLEEEHSAVMKEKKELEEEKSAKQTALVNFRALPTKLAQQKEKFDAADQRLQGLRGRVESLRDKQDQVSVERAAAAVEYTTAVGSLRKVHEELVQAEIMSIEAISDFETLKERNSEVTKTLEAKNAEVDEAARQLTELKKRVHKAREDTSAVRTQLKANQELLDIVNGYSPDQLEGEIDSEKARLELTHEGSSNVIKEFEERQRRIDKLNKRISESQQELTELGEAIAELRGKWEPQLEALIGKISDAFSDNFARIGCAGQVSIDKAENIVPAEDADQTDSSSDFDQWSVRIQVKFREYETLSVLDSHRQSGGERAVSTIFYLMALQSLSASPFRVVDEINQGMDPRNERMVHERMVDIACGQADSDTAGGQYFLITPKLLSGLAYKRGMTVLCIFSGEYMPEDFRKLDFGRCVSRMEHVLQQKSQRAGNGHGPAGRIGVGVGAA